LVVGNTFKPGQTSTLPVLQSKKGNADFAGTVGATDGRTVTVPVYQPTVSTLDVVARAPSLALVGRGALGMIAYGLRRRKAVGA